MLSVQKTKYIEDYDSPVNWNVSGFGNDEITNVILKLYEFCESRNIPFPIQSVHGMYGSRFNGGRVSLYSAPNEKIIDRVVTFNSKNIAVKLTLTNMNISSKDFEDPNLRFLLDTISRTSNDDNPNAVICVLDEFAEFIRKEYPNLQLVSSHVKMEKETKLGVTDTPDYYNNLFGLYDLVVVNGFRAFDDEFISQIKCPGRIEFIVNHGCTVNCQMGCLHHKLSDSLSIYNEKILNGTGKPTDAAYMDLMRQFDKLRGQCIKKKLENNEDLLKYQAINKDEIQHLLGLGVNHFKIEGRDLPTVNMTTALYKYVFNSESCISLYKF